MERQKFKQVKIESIKVVRTPRPRHDRDLYREQAPQEITACLIFKWILSIIFIVSAVYSIFKFKFPNNIIVTIGMGFIGWMWTPYFDNWSLEHNQRVSGWAKFLIMWIILAVFSFGGFYKENTLNSNDWIIIILASFIGWLILRFMKKKNLFEKLL